MVTNEFRCDFCRKMRPIDERVRPFGISIPRCCQKCKPLAERWLMMQASKQRKAL